METNNIRFGKFIFKFPCTLKVEANTNEYYSTLAFIKGENKWEVVNNFAMGYRLIINEPYFSWKDMPFHSGTYNFLPEEIIVEETND